MYFVLYDLEDNIIAYFDCIEELAIFVNRRVRQLRYEFKERNFVYIQDKNVFKVYKFI